MQDPGPVRVLRGTLAAGTATAVALGGHLLGGGNAPGPLGVLLPLWLSVAISSVLVGTRLSLPRISLAVFSSQVIFHLLFVLGAPASSGGPGVFSPGAHHDHAAMLAGTLPSSGAATGTGASFALTSLLAAPMLACHLLATFATIALLFRGELLLRRALGLGLAALARIGVVALLPRPVHPPRRAPRGAAPSPWILPVIARALVGPRAGRAPPHSACA